VVGYHPEAYLNKRQNKTIFVARACPRWDSIGTEIRSFFGITDKCTVATDTVGLRPGTEGYELLLQHERERVERFVERQGVEALAQLHEYFGEFDEDDDVTTKNAQSVLNTMLWLAGEHRLQRYCVRKLEEDFGYICRDATVAHDLYWVALGGWDLATERNGDNDAEYNAAVSRAGLYLAAGGTEAIEIALGKKIADVSDDTLRLLAGLRGVANAMKVLGVKNLVSVDVNDLNAKLFTVSKWWKLYQELIAFNSKFGHTLVPQQYKTKEGLNLGEWVHNQRTEWKRKQNSKKDSWLTDERERLLNDLSFAWSARDEIWNNFFRALAEYNKEWGNARVPTAYKTEDGLNLGKWVDNQRTMLKKVKSDDDISKERVRLLTALDFVWNAQEAKWLDLYDELVKFQENFGNARVPTAYKTEDGLNLGKWVNNQRTMLKKVKSDDDIGKERVRLLTALDFVWDAQEAKWQDHYHELVKFQEMFGHTLVPQQYKTENRVKLGEWVHNQRTEWKRKQKQNGNDESWLRRERLLNNLCFVWEPRG
jgi:hypothetical protein